jgi:tetratricopeptide (TPR) repeat protein
MDALGIPIPESFQGESLLGLMFGTEESTRAFAYTETFYPRLHYGWSELRALYDDEMKFILAPEEELYRFRHDTEETENLAPDLTLGSRKKDMEVKLRAFIDGQHSGAVSPSEATLSREDLQALTALGYATTRSDTPDDRPLPDPKSKIDVFNLLERATDRLNEEDYDEAISLADEVIRREPGLMGAHALLGKAFQGKRMYREALESFYHVAETDPDFNFIMVDIVNTLINAGDYDRAIREAGAYIEDFPDHSLLHEEMGFAYFFKRDFANALIHLERSHELESNPVALSKAGEIYAIQGDFATAESYLRRALELVPATKGSYYALAQIEEARGNTDQALDYYDRELENDPSSFRASFNAAVLLRNKGRYDLAIPYYRRTIAANPGFNMSYFMIANYLFEQNQDLDEAVSLCQQGIEVMPDEESALIGYQILTRIYAKLGDEENYNLWLRRGNEAAKKFPPRR